MCRLTMSLGVPGSRNCVDDLAAQAREALQVRAPFGLEPLHDAAVLVGAALPRVELAGLEDLLVVDARHRAGDLVAEVVVAVPLDGSLGDRLDHRARVG